MNTIIHVLNIKIATFKPKKNTRKDSHKIISLKGNSDLERKMSCLMFYIQSLSHNSTGNSTKVRMELVVDPVKKNNVPTSFQKFRSKNHIMDLLIFLCT